MKLTGAVPGLAVGLVFAHLPEEVSGADSIPKEREAGVTELSMSSPAIPGIKKLMGEL